MPLPLTPLITPFCPLTPLRGQAVHRDALHSAARLGAGGKHELQCRLDGERRGEEVRVLGVHHLRGGGERNMRDWRKSVCWECII